MLIVELADVGPGFHWAEPCSRGCMQLVMKYGVTEARATPCVAPLFPSKGHLVEPSSWRFVGWGDVAASFPALDKFHSQLVRLGFAKHRRLFSSFSSGLGCLTWHVALAAACQGFWTDGKGGVASRAFRQRPGRSWEEHRARRFGSPFWLSFFASVWSFA